MRLAIIYDAVYPYVLGGAERRNHALAGLLRHEHKVSIYGFHYWKGRSEGRLPGCRYVSVGAPLPLYRTDGRRRIVEAVVFAIRLFFALLKSREEVWDVGNFPYFSVPVAWLVSRIKRRRLVVTWLEFWGDYWYGYLGWRGMFGKAVERLALRCSPRVITVSEHTRRRLLAAGCPDERVAVVPCGVDLASILHVARASQQSDLIYVGRLVAHKRVDLLIEALAVLRRTRPQTTLCVVGDGPQREALERLTVELRLAESVRFAGAPVDAAIVYALLKSSRVFVSASQREGFGIAVIEAWACGIPAVVCEAPESAMPELVDSDYKGCVVPPSADAIAAGCSKLLTEQPLKNHDALIEAAAHYDWGRIALRLNDIYRRCLETSE